MSLRDWKLAIPFVLIIAMVVGAVVLVNSFEVGDSSPRIPAPGPPPNPCPPSR